MERYKKKALNFSRDVRRRDLQSYELCKSRKENKHIRLSALRHIDPSAVEELDDSIASVGKVAETSLQANISKHEKKSALPSRLEMLKKWKEEKELKKQLELQKSKPPFVVGKKLPIMDKVKGDNLHNQTSILHTSRITMPPPKAIPKQKHPMGKPAGGIPPPSAASQRNLAVGRSVPQANKVAPRPVQKPSNQGARNLPQLKKPSSRPPVGASNVQTKAPAGMRANPPNKVADPVATNKAAPGSRAFKYQPLRQFAPKPVAPAKKEASAQDTAKSRSSFAPCNFEFRPPTNLMSYFMAPSGKFFMDPPPNAGWTPQQYKKSGNALNHTSVDSNEENPPEVKGCSPPKSSVNSEDSSSKKVVENPDECLKVISKQQLLNVPSVSSEVKDEKPCTADSCDASSNLGDEALSVNKAEVGKQESPVFGRSSSTDPELPDKKLEKQSEDNSEECSSESNASQLTYRETQSQNSDACMHQPSDASSGLELGKDETLLLNKAEVGRQKSLVVDLLSSIDPELPGSLPDKNSLKQSNDNSEGHCGESSRGEQTDQETQNQTSDADTHQPHDDNQDQAVEDTGSVDQNFALPALPFALKNKEHRLKDTVDISFDSPTPGNSCGLSPEKMLTPRRSRRLAMRHSQAGFSNLENNMTPSEQPKSAANTPKTLVTKFSELQVTSSKQMLPDPDAGSTKDVDLMCFTPCKPPTRKSRSRRSAAVVTNVNGELQPIAESHELRDICEAKLLNGLDKPLTRQQQRKISLLGSPQISSKGPRKSIKGDLISFSPIL